MMKQMLLSSYSILVELTKVILILWGFLNFSIKKDKITYLITGTGFILLSVFSGFYSSEIYNFNDTIYLIFVSLSAFIIFQGKALRKMVWILLVNICIIFYDIFLGGIFSLIFGFDLFDMIDSFVMNLLNNAFSIFTFSIIILMKKKKRGSFGNEGLFKKLYLLLITGAAAGAFIIGGLMVISLPGAGERVRRTILFISIISCIVYFIVCMFLIIISDSRDKYKVLSQINEMVAKSQQRYYMLAKEKQDEIRAIRHEMKNHFTCLSGLYQLNKIEEMGNYINQMIENTEKFDNLFDTGNDIVNAIINDVDSRYKKEGISILLTGVFPKELNIKSMDLCIIFANAFSNAVEAIQRMDRKKEDKYYIHIRITHYKDDLYIDISNPIDHTIDISDGFLITSKNNKELHGFGTKNMKQVVNKYHGDILFQSTKSEFSVQIHMKNVSVSDTI